MNYHLIPVNQAFLFLNCLPLVSMTLFSPASLSGLSSSSLWPSHMEFPRDHPCTSLSMTSSLAVSCLYITLQTKPASVSLALTSLISILLAGWLSFKLSISKAEVIFLTKMALFFKCCISLSSSILLSLPSPNSLRSSHAVSSLTRVSSISSYLSISGLQF